MSESDRGVELARRAVAIGEGLDDAGLLATTRYYLGYSLTIRGDYHQALAVLHLNLSPLASDPRLGGAPVSLTTRAWTGHCLSELGEFDEAAALGEETLQSAQQDGRADAVAQAMLGVAHVARVRDDHPTAIVWYERVIELGRTQSVPFAVILGTANLGQTLARAGRPSEARPLLERGLLLLERAGNLFQYTMHLGWLARVCDAEGDIARALDLARQSVDQAAAQGHRGVLAENRCHLATILAHAGASDAEGTYREALALAEELGMRPLQAQCHLGLGQLYRKLGRAEDARAELSRAVTLFREMGMAFWLPEAETELAQLTG
jgi:tetratricopeptide (TPR) repeat protein